MMFFSYKNKMSKNSTLEPKTYGADSLKVLKGLDAKKRTRIHWRHR